jgi:hypothetical protein
MCENLDRRKLKFSLLFLRPRGLHHVQCFLRPVKGEYHEFIYRFSVFDVN